MLGGQHYSATVGNIEYYKNASQIIVHTELQKADMLKMDMFSQLRHKSLSVRDRL